MEDKEIVRIALERYKFGAEYMTENWLQMESNIKFAQQAIQWPSDIEQKRKDKGRPCLTINRLPAFIRQVVGSQRQMRPSIKVRPVDSVSDPETAEVHSDIIRHVEYKSKAKHAYDNGFTYAVTCGIGYWKVSTDYVNPQTFDQDIIITRIFNSFSVVLDYMATEKDKSDAKWGFITEWMSNEEYKQTYPDADVVNFETAENTAYSDWVRKDEVMIAGYYELKETKEKIYLMDDGRVLSVKELEELQSYVGDEDLGSVVPVNERETVKTQLIYRVMSGNEILETKEIDGKYIPIIPCYGEEIYKDGRPYYVSLIHAAIDAQRMYNYWSSTDTEFIALQPKAPYLVTSEQIKGYEMDWATANADNASFLPYNHVPNVPPPQRQMPPQLSTAIGTAALRAVDDMKATMGLFDPSMGSKSSAAESGKAITALQRQGETSTYIWIDNLETAINHTGRVVLDLIPSTYDTARVFRIQGEDSKNKVVEVNQPSEDGIINDLSKGEYDIVIETGPSYATKRLEAVDSMMKMIAAYPRIMELAGDLLAGNMDWPGADELTKRIRKSMPPGLVEPEEGEEPPPPPQPTPEDQLKAQELQLKEQEMQLEAEKLEVEKMKVEVDMEKVRVDAMNNEEDSDERMRRIAMDVVAEVHGGEGGVLD